MYLQHPGGFPGIVQLSKRLLKIPLYGLGMRGNGGKVHSRPQRLRSFWSAPGIETSGRLQNRKSAIHGLIVKYDKSDWLKNTERGQTGTLRMLRNWERPEVSIPGADQKDRGLWGREWERLKVSALFALPVVLRAPPIVHFSCFFLPLH